MVRILSEPKNSIIKQYQKLFALDKIELDFDEDSIDEIAKKAIERKTGARGLRAIVENILLETMFESPSKKNVKKVKVFKEVVTKDKQPEVVLLSKEEEKEREKIAVTVIEHKTEKKA